MRWLQLEYVAKGLFLGLLLFIALQQPDKGDIDWLLLLLLGGVAAALAIAAVGMLRQGYRIKGRLVPFVLFLILENPGLTYAGVLGGAVLAAFLVPKTIPDVWLLPATLGGGVALGLGFPFVRLIRNRWARSTVGLVLSLAPVGVILGLIYLLPGFITAGAAAGAFLLFGLPFFYLLTFAGRAEETEVEIGAICAMMCLGLWLWQPIPMLRTVAFLLPALIYYAYTNRFLPRMRIFKYVMRGMSYHSVGRHRPALLAFRRALELDPKDKLARDGMWAVHRTLDLAQAARDPELVALVDPGMCLNRASALLIDARPTAEQLKEATHLLDFVLQQRPSQRPPVLYWRCVAHLKTGEADRAAEELTAILDPAGHPNGEPNREAIVFQAWQLALLLHSEMQRRVGGPQLAIPGRRMEAIGVVERRLAENPDNPPAWDLKRLLYANLTEEEYNQKAGADRAADDFDHPYVQQLGLALLSDRGRWQRGAEYLRIAARGLPAQGPSIFVQVANAANQAGDAPACWHYHGLAQQAGRTIGAKNLGADDQQAYFSAVKLLADHAAARNDFDAAIDSYQLYAESERAGIETLRTLARLYEDKARHDSEQGTVPQGQLSILNALRVTEQALLYDARDKDLLERKDRYYNDVQPETLQAHREQVQKWFDVAYCLRKARSILDSKTTELAMLDWALQLSRVTRAVQPRSISAMLLEARAWLRRGERDKGLTILEDLRELPAEKIADDDQDSWYLAHRILGELYLNEVARPDLAIGCFTEFRKSAKSGADTWYKLGQAYEACGDFKKAAGCYEQVTGYEGHPLMYEARQALSRVRNSESSTA